MSESGAFDGQRDIRLEQMARIGPAGVATLRTRHVAIIGAGNLGGQTFANLGLLGIRITLVDRDRVGPENLLTQAFMSGEIGLPKVVARAEAMRRLNPACLVRPLHASVESLGLGVLRDADLILVAVDSMRSRIAINESAIRLGKPWIDAAIDGSGLSYTARVAAYSGKPDGACLLCSHDIKSLQALAGGDDAPTGCPTLFGRTDPVTAPTLAVPALGAAAASAQSTWAIEFLLGRGGDLVGREAHFDLFRMAMRSHRLPVNPECLLDHRAFDLTPIGRPVEEVSVAHTLRIAEAALGSGVTFRLNRRRLVTELRCAECDERSYPYRVLEAMTEDDARCRQGHVMQPLAFGLRDRLAPHERAAVMSRTWGVLGLPSEDVVTAVRGEAEIHLLFAASTETSAASPRPAEEDPA